MKSKIILIGLVLGTILIGGCTQKQEATTITPTCNKPYILVSMDCCLDENDDGICDKDKPITTLEPTTSIITTTSVTTSIATTSTTLTTTTSLCSNNDDCGGTIHYVECQNTTLYNITNRSVCRIPNTQRATCVFKGSQKEIIRENCKNENVLYANKICKEYNCPKGCYNRIQDNQEDGADCGALCIPCTEGQMRYENPCNSSDDCFMRGSMIDTYHDCSQEVRKDHVVVDVQIREVCVNPGKPNSHCERKRIEMGTGWECNRAEGYDCYRGECRYHESDI